MKFDFAVGDTIQVHQKIKEGDPSAGSGQVKTRIQVFEGIVISINHNSKTYTVRKISDGIGVERIFPIETPWVEKIVVKRKAKKIRRAKLYYLRGLTPKESARVVA